MIERFWLFHCAYARVPRRLVVDGGGWDLITLPFLCGVAEHSEYGPILIDAPYGHEGPSNLGALMSRILQRTGLVFRERWSVIPRLEELDLRAADVAHILMTHLHYDHTGGMKTLAHAQFHLSRQEWDFAHQQSSRRAAARGYARSDFEGLAHCVSLYDSVPHLADSDEGLDVLDDGSIEMYFLPGHSPGHCGYRIHLQDGSTIFFAGDAAYTIPQVWGEEGLGLMPTTVATSLGGVEVSLRALRRHLTEHSDDILITSHEIGLGERCIRDGPICFGG